MSSRDSMRYVKCYNCGIDVSGQPKYIFSWASETKGKHRNSEQQVLARLCDDCGLKIYREIGADQKGICGERVVGHMKRIYEFDQKKELKRRMYKDIKIEYIKDTFDGKPFTYETAELIKSKRYLLTQKIKAISELFTWRLIYDYDDVDSVVIAFDSLSLLYGLITDMGYRIDGYTINPDVTFIDYEYKYKNKKLVNFEKGLKTVKSHYIDKMQGELKDSEYKEIIATSLIAIYKRLSQEMVTGKSFIKISNGSIDVSSDKKDKLVSV